MEEWVTLLSSVLIKLAASSICLDIDNKIAGDSVHGFPASCLACSFEYSLKPTTYALSLDRKNT